MAEPRYTQQLYFDPDEHPEDTLKSFEEFCQVFELRYEAQYPDPPKVSMDAAIRRWKVEYATEESPDPRPTLPQYDTIRDTWQSKDKVAKLLGMFSSNRLYTDWKMAEPNERSRKEASWDEFRDKIKIYYKPTENPTLMNFHFRALNQENNETFPSFCNRVMKEAKHCHFKCRNEDCTAEDIAIRDQIVIGLKDSAIREDALKKSWDLVTLRMEGMKMESAARSGAEISGDLAVNKMGKYSYQALKKGKKTQQSEEKRIINCYSCGNQIFGSIAKHRSKCAATSAKCKKCGKIGHLANVCRKSTDVRQMEDDAPTGGNDEHEDQSYQINVFRIKTSSVKPKLQSRITNRKDFRVQVVVHNSLNTVIADTGARISVVGTSQAKKWGILKKMLPSIKKIKPYSSPPIAVHGEARCTVTFGSRSIPVIWHIISGSCEPILDGHAALQLGIISFNAGPDTFQPILMIDTECKEDLQNVLQKYPQNFIGLGKLTNHQVKLHVDKEVKPFKSPPRSIPYHLRDRTEKLVHEMISQDVIEEHPGNEPAPWVANCVLAPKDDGSIRMTMDARNVNKAILPTNQPIPRHEDVKAKLAGKKVFSKMDFKSAFWQLELAPESRYLTAFQVNDKLYRYKRLTMGLKPSQGELNAALGPVFAHIKDAHLIHDDLIVATETNDEHRQAIEEVMEAIKNAGLTLNPQKCHFGRKSISFWGMIYEAEGIRPDPAKVEALEYVTSPKNKSELVSFLCMMQSNADFIPNFAQKSAVLRQITKSQVRFNWQQKHQECFEDLIAAFRKEVLLEYFDMKKKTFVFTDAHITGLGAMLAQGDSIEDAKPVAFASRTTHGAESRYPQLDLEAMGLDFGLRRFRHYLVGSPQVITVVTDHKPLCPIFNGNREGSIRTERIKMRHQDIQFDVVFQKGKLNQTDFISRRGKPYTKLNDAEQCEMNDLSNLLYTLHSTPVIDKIDLQRIADKTREDPVLRQIMQMVQQGKTWMSKEASPDMRKFAGVMGELMLTSSGILLKNDRIVLPHALHNEAIKLAHKGSHPRQSAMERRLRSHFFFHNMRTKVEEFLKTCLLCPAFSSKRTAEPIQPHSVPSKSWEIVAVDLFGPMPSSRHVVVVQDLGSRFPAAKLVTSTGASKVLPALRDIYDAYGNPKKQISDNGPPFNSQAMRQFTTDRGIEMQQIPPLHPSANPAETFMRPLGKTMKIAHFSKTPEDVALRQLLLNYRDTPHPSTGISPSAMMFRDGQEGAFPRVTVSEETANNARDRDRELKDTRGKEVNSSKFRKEANITVGDSVLMRNHRKRVKFDPDFIPERFKVIDVANNGRIITILKEADGSRFIRHPDDIKIFEGSFPNSVNEPPTQGGDIQDFHRRLLETNPHDADEDQEGDERYPPIEVAIPCEVPQNLLELPNNTETRRSNRIRRQNVKYYNENFET